MTLTYREKVQDLAGLWGAIQHLVGIILLVNKALQRDAGSTLCAFVGDSGFYDSNLCGAKGLPSDHAGRLGCAFWRKYILDKLCLGVRYSAVGHESVLMNQLYSYTYTHIYII